MLPELRKITPEDAIRTLKEHGTIITLKEAELLLDFLYKFAGLILHTVFKEKAKYIG